MSGLILALNAGSSSLKCALFEPAPGRPRAKARTTIDAQSRGPGHEAVMAALRWADDAASGEALAGVGHRIVHGGPTFHAPVLLNAQVIEALDALTPLAPLHQPPALDAARVLLAARPSTPQVAAFDTAFHWDQPPVAQRLGLPREWHDRGVRRYGFHGLSYAHIAARLSERDPALASGKVVAAHLGSGASLCAMSAGRSVDTTMGFSPLDGLLMATRCGALDPGVVLYLHQHEGLDASQLQDLLYHRSGLLGVSGLTGDMRALLDSPDPAAREAVDLFIYRVCKEIAALAGVLGGLDGVVFTGGIGQNSDEIRTRIGERLHWLGLELDARQNIEGGERLISTQASRLRAWVIPADEESIVARETARALALDPSQG